MVAWHGQNDNCFHTNMLLGDNTYKPLKETFQIMFENVNNDYKCLCLFGKVQGGTTKLYMRRLYPLTLILIYTFIWKKGAPFTYFQNLPILCQNKLQKKEIILSFSEVPIKGNDTAISCICSKYCNNWKPSK